MRRAPRKVFGQAGLDDGPRRKSDPVQGERKGFKGWWCGLPIGRRALIAVFGMSSVLVTLGLGQGVWHIATPDWLGLLALVLAVCAVAYAYTRRCPSCGAGGVVTWRGPQRSCDQCGTSFL
jgi:hypothetical protein